MGKDSAETEEGTINKFQEYFLRISLTTIDSILFTFALIIGFVILTTMLVLLRYWGISIPIADNYQIKKPFEGLVWFCILLSITAVTGIGLELSTKLKRIGGKIGGWLWRWSSVSNNSPTQLESYILERKRELYIDFATKQISSLFLVSGSPWVLSYLYIGDYDLMMISLAYLGLGILIGSFENAFSRTAVRVNLRESHGHEIRSVIANQFEVYLLFLSVFVQAGHVLGLDFGEFTEFVTSLVVAGVMIWLTFAIWNKLRQPISESEYLK